MVPATIIVLPRLNSLIGTPKPIATMPAPVSKIPSIYKITDILARAVRSAFATAAARCYG